MIERAPAEAEVGDLVAIRRTDGREAHDGMLADDCRFIYAIERFGVVEVPLSAWAGRIAWVVLLRARAGQGVSKVTEAIVARLSRI